MMNNLNLNLNVNVNVKPIKIAFAGTPEFAAEILAFLHSQANIEIKMVLSMPDRPKGRGLELQPTPVKAYAMAQGLNIIQPASLSPAKNPEAIDIQSFLKEEVDFLVVVAYGMLLPALFVDEIICLNIHASLLPRWRGAAPIQRAIEAGDEYTGISIMHMNQGLDTGDVLYEKSTPILEKNTLELTLDLQNIAQESILYTLQNYAALAAEKKPQLIEGITYAEKIQKAEAMISFSQNTKNILQKMRAFNPFPAIAFQFQGVIYKVWAAQKVDEDFLNQQNIKQNLQENLKHQRVLDEVSGSCPIYFFEDVLIIQTQDAYLSIEKIQAPNKKAMPVQEFLRGFKYI